MKKILVVGDTDPYIDHMIDYYENRCGDQVLLLGKTVSGKYDITRMDSDRTRFILGDALCVRSFVQGIISGLDGILMNTAFGNHADTPLVYDAGFSEVLRVADGAGKLGIVKNYRSSAVALSIARWVQEDMNE